MPPILPLALLRHGASQYRDLATELRRNGTLGGHESGERYSALVALEKFDTTLRADAVGATIRDRPLRTVDCRELDPEPRL